MNSEIIKSVATEPSDKKWNIRLVLWDYNIYLAVPVFYCCLNNIQGWRHDGDDCFLFSD